MTTDLPFPKSLPDFQKLFPTDDACASYLEKIKWPFGFMCPTCHEKGYPYRFAGKPALLRCRVCKRNTSITVGTVMERTHIDLSTWFWGAYLLSSMTPGMSAVQFQRQLGLGRYETAFQILHKLRAGMVRSDRDRIGTGSAKDHVEIDETNVGGRTRGEGRGVHHQTLVIAAVEVRQRVSDTKDKKQNKAVPRRGGRYAGRLRLEVVPNRTAKSLTRFVTSAVEPGSMVITDDWSGYDKLTDLGYQHLPVAERGDPQVAEEYLPIVHLIFSNMKAWLHGVHHGVAPQHLQAYLNEFTFRFNRRFYPLNAFRSLLGIGSDTEAPTYAELYSGDWQHPTVCGHG